MEEARLRIGGGERVDIIIYYMSCRWVGEERETRTRRGLSGIGNGNNKITKKCVK